MARTATTSDNRGIVVDVPAMVDAMMHGDRHVPVLPDEVLDALALRTDGVYFDATFGRGGHSRLLLSHLGESGRVYALDRDPAAAAAATELMSQEPRMTFAPDAFSGIAEVAERFGVLGKVDGVLFDLGVSSPQLDDPSRGFSFLRDGPLDMRMDPRFGSSAREWLARQTQQELADILREYGEERYAGRIARVIVEAMRGEGLSTTLQLADLIAGVAPTRERRIHPATRTFLALRIAVNGELEELRAGLAGAIACLRGGGRLAAISFHSVEDRVVKRFLRGLARPPELPRGLPVMDAFVPTVRLVGRPRRPTPAEIAVNPRARSATLRVAEKVAA